MKTIIYLLCIIFCVGCAEDIKQQENQMKIYAGGVDGLALLKDPLVSQGYRFLGGNFFHHNVGWIDQLTIWERLAIEIVTRDHGHAAEFGPSNGPAHGRALAQRLVDYYWQYNINLDFIIVDLFAERREPTPEHWVDTCKHYRDIGYCNPIYPTFENGNHIDLHPTLLDNLVSKRQDFQEIIRFAGGIVLDSPPAFFLADQPHRENYRRWVVDAMAWTRCFGGKVILIASPHRNEGTFLEDTKKQLRYLERLNLTPDILIVENYRGGWIGPDTDTTSCLGVATELLKGGY